MAIATPGISRKRLEIQDPGRVAVYQAKENKTFILETGIKAMSSIKIDIPYSKDNLYGTPPNDKNMPGPVLASFSYSG